MDDQPNSALYNTGMFALIFLLAFLLSNTVFKERGASRSHFAVKKVAEKALDQEKQNDKIVSEIPDTIAKEDRSTENESFDFEEKPTVRNEEIELDSFEERLKSRADSIQSLLANGQRRTDVILRYYPHRPDGKIVYSLSDLGFYLHERTTDPDQVEKPSNSLFYGDNVPIEDIQLVAYELVKRGVQISQIKISRFHDDWKVNSIEIGTEESAEELPVLSLAEIQNFKKANEE